MRPAPEAVAVPVVKFTLSQAGKLVVSTWKKGDGWALEETTTLAVAMVPEPLAYDSEGVLGVAVSGEAATISRVTGMVWSVAGALTR